VGDAGGVLVGGDETPPAPPVRGAGPLLKCARTSTKVPETSPIRRLPRKKESRLTFLS
jgi:hypothetical protein